MTRSALLCSALLCLLHINQDIHTDTSAPTILSLLTKACTPIGNPLLKQSNGFGHCIATVPITTLGVRTINTINTTSVKIIITNMIQDTNKLFFHHGHSVRLWTSYPCVLPSSTVASSSSPYSYS